MLTTIVPFTPLEIHQFLPSHHSQNHVENSIHTGPWFHQVHPWKRTCILALCEGSPIDRLTLPLGVRGLQGDHIHRLRGCGPKSRTWDSVLIPQ